MMRNSTLLKWAQNNKHAGKNGNRNWIHPPDALQRGHIAYLVKFLGNTEVDQPKGIEVVKEGIRKLKFNQQLRKAEGNKTPKVELTISIDGVAIQEPKTKRIMHQYPLHRISYCADDKGEKKFFSFIAKEADSEKHICFVFVSDKLAEEITLTIGQAFDLAYRRFLDTSGKDLEVQRRLILLQQKVKRLETENKVLRQRLEEVAQIKGRGDVDDYMQRNSISDLLVVNGEVTDESDTDTSSNSTNGNGNLLNLSINNITTNGVGSGLGVGNCQSPSPTTMQPPPVPPRAFEAKSSGFGDDLISDLISISQPVVGTKLEGLLLDELDDDFNPRAHENSTSNLNGMSSPPPLLAPPPKPPRDSRRGGPTSTVNGVESLEKDLFGSVPFNPSAGKKANPRGKTDPFGMGDFGNDSSPQELENAIGILDKKILEMKDGFSRGLSFGNEDFSLESLDPLKN